MDSVSTEVVQMCTTSEEIQKLWSATPFCDHIAKRCNRRVGTLGVDQNGRYTFGLVPVDLWEVVWIPAVSQLCNLLERHESAARLCLMVGTFGLDVPCKFNQNDMHALWIAYYMYKKHRKVWTGKEWVRVTTHAQDTNTTFWTEDEGKPSVPHRQ